MHVSTSSVLGSEHIHVLRRTVDEALLSLALPEEPADLYDAVRYVLAGKGKRLRPILLLLTAEAFDVPAVTALPAALAVEVFHNFTLVHDDIMDDSPERRGRPSVHARWDADTALLTGDYLLALAYEMLGRCDAAVLPASLPIFSGMVARLCEGQALDKAFEKRDDVTVAAYLHMIDGKTGALLETCFELGGVLGGASEPQRERLRALGNHVGRAFQIQDDLLDLTADDDRWGKPIGGDLLAGKKTFLVLQALERADGDEHAWLVRILTEGGLQPDEVPEARRRMERLGVLQEAEAAVAHHTDSALDALKGLPDYPARATLRSLLRTMQARGH